MGLEPRNLAGSGGNETIPGHAGPSEDGTLNCEGGEIFAASTAPLESEMLESTGMEDGTPSAPFLYDGSAEAEAWFRMLVKENPDRRGEDILDDYAKGEAWCRPPGAVPPYDAKNPFGQMELEYDDLGQPSFVEVRDERGRKKVWYAYASNGQLRKWVRGSFGSSGAPANANLFGKAAAVTREKVRELRGRI